MSIVEPYLRDQEGDSPEKETAEWREFVGDRHAEEGNFSRAVGEYKRAVKLDPNSTRVSRVADAYSAAEMSEKALEYYQKALEMDSHNSDAHIGIGDLCVQLAMSRAAVISYERAVRCNPRRAYFRFKLAVALATTGHLEQAKQELFAAVELSPQAPFYRFLLADVHLELDEINEAVHELERVVELAPRDEYYHVRLGAARLRAGMFDEAIESFEEAVRLGSDNLSYRRLLGYAYQLSGQFELARRYVNDGEQLDAYDEEYVQRVKRLASNGRSYED